MRAAYAPDNLIPIQMVGGDPLVRSIAGLPTLMNMNDVQQGAGNAAVQQGVESLASSFNTTNVDATSTAQANAASVATPDDCSQFTVGSWDWSQCIGAKAQSAVDTTVGISGDNSWLNRGLIGLLGLVIVAGGIVFFALKD